MASQKKETVRTSDGLDLIIEVDVPPVSPRGVVILLHGWSGSPRHFDRNVPALIDSGYTVLRPHLRGHGASPASPHSSHVARLAADAAAVLAAPHLCPPGVPVHAVGTSLGAAIWWSHAELFGPDCLASHTFVDQVPLQNRDPATGWALGSRGIYDGPSLAALRAALVADPAAAAADTVNVCLTRPAPAAEAAAFVAEATRADAEWLGRLMADHTALDWRPLLRAWRGGRVLVVVGGATKCHDPAGVRAVGELIGSAATTVEMPGGSHWCYWEDAPAFNTMLLAFLDGKASE